VNQSLAHALAPMLELDEEIQARHGLAFETVHFQACMALGISGEVDGCQTGPTVGINPIAHGADLKAVIQIFGQTTEITMSSARIEAMGIALDAPLEDRIRALEGITIAGPGPGTSMHMIVEKLMEREGKGIDAVTYQPLTDLAAMNAGLRLGRIDAAIWSLGGMSPSQADGSGQVWISFARGDVPKLGALPNVATFARTEWVNENRDTLSRVQAALVDVLNAFEADPNGYGATYKAAYLEALPRAIWERDIQRTIPAYIDDMEGTCEAWDFWVDRLNIGGAGDAELARCNVAYEKLRP